MQLARKPNEKRHCMHEVLDTSSTLTFVWSSRQAFQGNQRTVICLLLFHTEGKKVDWWAIHDCREKKERK